MSTVDGKLDTFLEKLVARVGGVRFQGEDALAPRDGGEFDELGNKKLDIGRLMHEGVAHHMDHGDDVGKGIVDQHRGRRPAEDHHRRRHVDEDLDIAAHDDGDADQRHSRYEADDGCDIHGKTYRFGRGAHTRRWFRRCAARVSPRRILTPWSRWILSRFRHGLLMDSGGPRGILVRAAHPDI